LGIYIICLLVIADVDVDVLKDAVVDVVVDALKGADVGVSASK
jgi:hypothetical protein